MIYGVGTDIIEIARVKRAVQNEHFRQRVFTSTEISYAEAKGQGKFASYAARWAAKEAVMKAFGTGMRQGNFHEIEIVSDDLGCPRLLLHGVWKTLAEEKGVARYHLSLSHSREYAIAECILEGGTR